MADEKIIEIKNLLECKKQIILYGPPGTGKTWRTKDIAVAIIMRDGKK